MAEGALSSSTPAASSSSGLPKEKDKDKEKDQALNELTFENLRLAVLDLQTEFPQALPALQKAAELLTAFEIARDYQNERLGREMRDQNRFKVRGSPLGPCALSTAPLSPALFPSPFLLGGSPLPLI